MKKLAVVVALLAAAPALAGEPVKGTNTSESTSRLWETGANSGYYMADSEGTTAWETGPFEDAPIECHSAGFWTSAEVVGDGICIFGVEPDRWTVVQEMAPGSNLWADKQSDMTQRQGVWRVVHGTGRFEGMTGSGTFVARRLADGSATTEVEGEIELAR